MSGDFKFQKLEMSCHFSFSRQCLHILRGLEIEIFSFLVKKKDIEIFS
jgi:hypothetical protein